MSLQASNPCRTQQAGFALLEVLVTLVILLFGLLGLAGVSSRANLAEMESYQRVQALQLLQDMSDRLSANRGVAISVVPYNGIALCYSNGSTGVTLGTGSTSIPSCTSTTAPSSTVLQRVQAVADLTAWDAMLKGSAESLTGSGSKVGAMIGAVGCITQDDAANNVYLIAVSWQGLAPTYAPTLANGTTPFPCGNGLYGNEKLHRVVTTKVQIGKLS
ncbi:MAG: type IV pilus modification protein PilV [Burkholderiaceae bacterium]|nr:MAG: type IV pilus modification protein PilV [Burkholderiaceae bacterium]